ncbi:MAG: hypothetical protein ABIK56_02125 [candidate division WOR-3 bacterium]
MKLTNIRDQQIFNVVLGITLGVVLGFVADITKRSLDDFQEWYRLRRIALKLLKEDTTRIYRTMWLYDRLIKTEGIPDEVKKTNTTLT